METLSHNFDWVKQLTTLLGLHTHYLTAYEHVILYFISISIVLH